MREQVQAALKRAAEILNGGEWTQGTNARRSDGASCSEFSDEACAWCLVGALYRAAYEVSDRPLDAGKPDPLKRAVYAAVKKVLPPWWKDVEGYNDLKSRTKADVLQMLATAQAVV